MHHDTDDERAVVAAPFCSLWPEQPRAEYTQSGVVLHGADGTCVALEEWPCRGGELARKMLEWSGAQDLRITQALLNRYLGDSDHNAQSTFGERAEEAGRVDPPTGM